MRRAIILAAGLLFLVTARAEEPGVKAGAWKAEWGNRFTEERGEWVFALTVTDSAVGGTVTIGGVSTPVEGRREGSWLEVSWTDAEGRVTQVRGVVGGGEWRGAVLSGGGGRLVEYGRMRATPTR